MVFSKTFSPYKYLLKTLFLYILLRQIMALSPFHYSLLEKGINSRYRYTYQYRNKRKVRRKYIIYSEFARTALGMSAKR